MDISEATEPEQVAVLKSPPWTTSEDVVVRRVNTPRFAGDLAAVGIQACVRTTERAGGLQFFDVTQPAAPVELGYWKVPRTTNGTRGCHEIDLVVTRQPRVLAGCANPGGADEVHLVDASDPHNPRKLVGFDAADLGVDPPRPLSGFNRSSFAHSIRFVEQGRELYVSYWDTGTLHVRLQRRDRLTLVERIVIAPPDEDGDNHSLARSPDGTTLLVNPEDLSPAGDVFGNDGCPRVGDEGWGELYVYGLSARYRARLLSTFDTRNSDGFHSDGLYSVHNSEFVTDSQVVASWFSDGVRWIDLSERKHPRERGRFVPPVAEDPHGFFPRAPLVWGVFVHRGADLILASDINSGLWIVRPDGLGDF